jgi:uncharacterized RDD family membrane protein YckC
LTELPTEPQTPDLPLAAWWKRGGALVIDSVPTWIIYGFAVAIYGESQASVENGTTSFNVNVSGTPGFVTLLLILAWGVVNWWWLQGTIGQTIGKKLLGIAVYRAGTTEPTGMPTSIGRYFARIFDTLPCFLGLLWPLWDQEKRTFADMMASTRVYEI